MGVDSINIRVLWPYNTPLANPPPGWVCDQEFDDRFLQGDSTSYAGPANAGADHDHTIGSHTHTGNSHAHNFSGAIVFTTAALVDDGGEFGGERVPIRNMAGRHTHSSTPSSAATISYVAASAITVLSTDMLPPYVKLAVLRPWDPSQDLPKDSICFSPSSSIPSDFSAYSALDGRFVLGAIVSGVGDTGGSATHTHSGTSHTHTDNSHYHGDTLCGPPDTWGSSTGSPSTSPMKEQHHDVGLDSTTDTLSSDSITVNAQSSEPAYVKLYPMQNGTWPRTPIGAVLAFVGAYGTIPSNWQLSDGTGGTIDCRNKQIKGTTTALEIGDTGGANSHKHTLADHGHTHSGHTHSANEKDDLTPMSRKTGSLSAVNTVSHSHTWTVETVAPSVQNASTSISTETESRYKRRTVLWIQKMSGPELKHSQPAVFLGANF